ncbi:MAG: M48 family metalloprotease [Pseudomonadota bacterium]|nr:M48 family metalloprotease [Pseudomonadota bacterium]
MRRFVVAALALTVGASVPACSQRQRSKLETTLATALVSEAEEREIGRQVHKELEKQGVTYVKQALVTQYVEEITERLATEVKREGAPDRIKVYVIDDPEMVNAFATPGGRLYVFSGLLLTAEDEAEVAGVIGHELGHIVAKHPAKRIALAMGYEALANLALGKDPGQLQQLAAVLLGGGVLAAHGRGEENEADRLGLTWLHRAGYDPRGMVRFFRRIKDLSADPPAVLAWLYSHPTTTSRIEHVREMLRRRGWEGGEEGVEAHREVREAILDAQRPRRARGGGT